MQQSPSVRGLLHDASLRQHVVNLAQQNVFMKVGLPSGDRGSGEGTELLLDATQAPASIVHTCFARQLALWRELGLPESNATLAPSLAGSRVCSVALFSLPILLHSLRAKPT